MQLKLLKRRFVVEGNSLEQIGMSTFQFEVEPYPLTFVPDALALILIEMQRDFLEHGGVLIRGEHA